MTKHLHGLRLVVDQSGNAGPHPGPKCGLSTISPHRRHSWVPVVNSTRLIGRWGHHQRAANRHLYVTRCGGAGEVVDIRGSGFIVGPVRSCCPYPINSAGPGGYSDNASNSTIHELSTPTSRANHQRYRATPRPCTEADPTIDATRPPHDETRLDTSMDDASGASFPWTNIQDRVVSSKPGQLHSVGWSRIGHRLLATGRHEGWPATCDQGETALAWTVRHPGGSGRNDRCRSSSRPSDTNRALASFSKRLGCRPISWRRKYLRWSARRTQNLSVPCHELVEGYGHFELDGGAGGQLG
jgi:hypothetical protein